MNFDFSILHKNANRSTHSRETDFEKSKMYSAKMFLFLKMRLKFDNLNKFSLK